MQTKYNPVPFLFNFLFYSHNFLVHGFNEKKENSILSPEQLEKMLLEMGQVHLFENWPDPGVDDDDKEGLLSQMVQSSWEVEQMLDVYIHDYLLKRKLHPSAKAFMTQGKVSIDPLVIHALGGFIFEWLSVFLDIFIA
ncbi:unnamed protein product [Lactuca saligna]|uniref:LisH domain-containing protein n=1 Tax=Lactuca saligna TaxID=75948 RepID=A0AA35Z5A1_LACSI|nr:unnamed protein product [Lactuca saligna]